MRFSNHRIALVDPYSEGHHLPWAVEFCLNLLRSGCTVQAIFPEPGRLGDEIAREAPALASRFEGVSSRGFAEGQLPKDRLQRPRTAHARWRQLNGMLRGLPRQPDHVFFAYLDFMLSPALPPIAVDRAFSYPWSGVYLHPVWTRMGRRLPMQLREGWALRAAGCRGVGLLDEGLVPRFERMLPRKSICQVPDFLSSNTERSVTRPHPEVVRRARGRTTIGLVGTLQSRKGMATLLRAALHPRGRDFFFVFAGQLSYGGFSDEERRLLDKALQERPENCYFHTEAIPCERTFVSYAHASDVLYAAYHRFPHSSNVLALASLLRRPVIVSQGYLMEERALRYKLGPAVPEGCPEATLHAIESLQADLRAHNPHKRHYEAYLRAHSRERLQDAMRILIDPDDKAKPEATEAGSSIPAA